MYKYLHMKCRMYKTFELKKAINVNIMNMYVAVECISYT